MTVAAPQHRNSHAASAEKTETSPEKSEFEKLLDREFKFSTEYVPFLGNDPIRLSPNLVIRYLCKPTKQGYLCTEEQATKFIMLCKARGLNPWEGDAHIVGYDTKDGPEFNMITAHQAFLKRAEVHPQYDGMESGVTVKHTETEEVRDVEGDYIPEECVLVGGWARVHFKNRKIPIYRRLDVRTFDKGFAQWSSNKGGMIVKCAEADALRSSFPNSLGGMYMDGEMPTTQAAEPTAETPKNGDAPARMSMRGGFRQTAVARTQPQPTADSPTDDSAPVQQQAPAQQPTPAGPPSWNELSNLGITRIDEPAGIAVQNADGQTLRPDGIWDDKYSQWTVQPNTPEQDALARTMAQKAATTPASTALAMNADAPLLPKASATTRRPRA